MNKQQKEEKRKRVRKIYLDNRERNLLPKKREAERKRIALEKIREQEKKDFLRILGTPLKIN